MTKIWRIEYSLLTDNMLSLHEILLVGDTPDRAWNAFMNVAKDLTIDPARLTMLHAEELNPDEPHD